MFVVCVDFRVKAECVSDFMPQVTTQAANSLHLENECHRFDVCVDREDPSRIFLYELYSDEAAFRSHLGSDHYATFDRAISGMVLSKEVKDFQLVPPHANRAKS